MNLDDLENNAMTSLKTLLKPNLACWANLSRREGKHYRQAGACCSVIVRRFSLW